MTERKKLYTRLRITPTQLINFCERNHILELSLFGSILQDDFRDDSDIDMLVVFDRSAAPHLSLMDVIGLEYSLQDLLGRDVDLVEKRAILDSSNWIRRDTILNTAQVIYASGRVLSA